jgi:outer membrane receptor protein involved in Fe transport
LKAVARFLFVTSTLVSPATLRAQATPAASLASSSESSGPAEIVVTAQKRSERLTDVPLSITAASGDQLQKQGITSPAELEHIVPGFTYQKSTYGTPIFTIRGVGLYDTSLGISPTVSVYVDQVPLPYLVMTEGAGLDLERLEVLKGPQGILFGQNSTGGAINYIAAKPTADPHMGFDLSGGRFNQINGEAYVSGPITDTLRARIAVRHEYEDPWQISQTRPNDRLGKRDFTAGRILVDWDPTSRLKFELNANAWVDKSDTQAFQYEGFVPARNPGYPEAFAALQNLPAAPKDARIADWNPGESFQRDDRFRQLSLRGDYDLHHGLTLTSITAYSHLNVYSPIDADGTAFNDFTAINFGKLSSFSQEVRLAADIGSRIKLTVGGNYQHDNVRETDEGDFDATNSGIGPVRYDKFLNISNQKVTTKAGFASADVKLTDTITAQGGLRYTQQDRHYSGCLADAGDGKEAAGIAELRVLSGLPFDPAAPGSCVTLDDSQPTLPTIPGFLQRNLNQHNLSWRAGLNWKPAQNSLIYANVTKGYKAGSFTPLPAVFSSQTVPVTQESVLAYEAGFKTELWNRKLQFTGAAFYYDYRNKQILGYKTFAGLGLNLPALQNIPKSHVLGGELSATLRPIKGLQITGGVTYVKSEVDGHVFQPDPLANNVDLHGESFPSTPKWQTTSDAEYDFALTPSLNAFLGGSLTYRTSTNAAFGDSPQFVLNGYALLDLRAGIEAPDGKWRIQIWGKNVTNKYYLTNVAHVTDAIAATTGRPASYGVTLSTRL